MAFSPMAYPVECADCRSVFRVVDMLYNMEQDNFTYKCSCGKLTELTNTELAWRLKLDRKK